MATGTRQRMYIFERAYWEYGRRVRRVLRGVGHTCGGTWDWFWTGLGAKAIEWLLRLAVIAGGVEAARLYVEWEASHGRGAVSARMVGVICVIFFVVTMILWGWKALVHFLARLLSGGTAAGVIACVAGALLAVATAGFSIYLVVLVVLTALSFSVFLPLRAGQEIWLTYRRVGYRCPHGECGATGLPVHLCGECGTSYSDLLPSFYGLFHHVCSHPDGSKTRLPTMDVLGRNKLHRLCRGCHGPLTQASWGELAEWPLLLAGGPNTGKTMTMTQAISQLRDHFRQMRGEARVDSSDQRQLFDDMERQLRNGQLLAKTAGGIADAWGVAVRVPKSQRYRAGIRCLLYIFDNPGEVYESMGEVGHMYALRHLRGILLMVDPFALPILAPDAKRLGSGVQPSQTPLKNVVDTVIQIANSYLKDRSTDRCATPLAVVITKADALPTHDYPFLANLIGTAGSPADDRCRAALIKLGASSSVNTLDLNFSKVRFFACSALGRSMSVNDSRPFQAEGVLDPFLWIIDEAAGIHSEEPQAHTARTV